MVLYMRPPVVDTGACVGPRRRAPHPGPCALRLRQIKGGRREARDRHTYAYGGDTAMDEGALLTGLYELHMMQAYHALGMEETAVFDLIVRRLPEGRNFLVATGLEQVLDYLAGLRFTEDELDW